MIPATYNPEVYQGDSFDLDCRLYAQELVNNEWVQGDALDLTGCVVKSEVRASATAPQVLATFTPTIPSQTIPENRGYVFLRLSDVQTAAIAAGVHVYDVEIKFPPLDATGDRDTFLAGTFTVKAQVTK